MQQTVGDVNSVRRFSHYKQRKRYHLCLHLRFSPRGGSCPERLLFHGIGQVRRLKLVPAKSKMDVGRYSIFFTYYPSLAMGGVVSIFEPVQVCYCLSGMPPVDLENITRSRLWHHIVSCVRLLLMAEKSRDLEK